MSAYQTFIFKNAVFSVETKQLKLEYAYDNQLHFTEIYQFNFDFVDYSDAALNRAINNLFFMAGVSYYKAYLAPSIAAEFGSLDQHHADFFAKTYQRGLGEFFYVNQLDPNTDIEFPVTNQPAEPIPVNAQGMLIGLGGGKDSLVSIEQLRQHDGAATWSVGHRSQLEPLSALTELPHYWVERSWDTQLLDINKQGGYNGHVPISAILACAGTVAAILSGKRDIVVSNERSADEPTLEYNGVAINHQFSKSSEFENDYQALLAADFGQSQRYYSWLRPYSELKIAEMFAELGFEKYKSAFSSCNRAFTHASKQMFWCGICPKCAFVFLIFAPFIAQGKLKTLFGKNLLLDPALESTYRQLLGIAGDKPLECVGEIKESRSAMVEAQKIYPELAKYQFEIPEGYNYAAVGPHRIPEDIIR